MYVVIKQYIYEILQNNTFICVLFFFEKKRQAFPRFISHHTAPGLFQIFFHIFFFQWKK